MSLYSDRNDLSNWFKVFYLIYFYPISLLTHGHKFRNMSKNNSLTLFKAGYECICYEGYYESPSENIDGTLNWTKMSCLPPRIKTFGNYSIEYVVFRTKSEYYSSRQMCSEIGLNIAKKDKNEIFYSLF